MTVRPSTPPAARPPVETERPLVSIVVPVRDGEADLPGLLACLAAQRDASPVEILVVDNGSRDRSAEIARAAGALVVPEERPGSYAARNRGAAEARGVLLAFLDVDCRPRPDWLGAGREALEENRHRIVAGRIRMETGPGAGLCERYDRAKYLDQEALVRDRGTAATANLWVSRTVFDGVGGFDGELVSGGDEDFCLRAREQGVEIAYREEVVVDHPPRRTLSALAAKSRRIATGSVQRWRKGRFPGWRLLGMALVLVPRTGLLRRGSVALFLLDWILKGVSATAIVREWARRGPGTRSVSRSSR